MPEGCLGTKSLVPGAKVSIPFTLKRRFDPLILRISWPRVGVYGVSPGALKATCVSLNADSIPCFRIWANDLAPVSLHLKSRMILVTALWSWREE